MKPSVISPSSIYEKVYTGEPISDDEIDAGIAHFSALGNMLEETGPAFSITASECRRVVDNLKRLMFMRQSMKPFSS
jgi:hypothetical protein